MLKNIRVRSKNGEVYKMLLEYMQKNHIVGKNLLIKEFIERYSLSTIYRGINRLLEKGLIISLQINKENYLVIIPENNSKPLYLALFVCENCNKSFFLNLDEKLLKEVYNKINNIYNFDTLVTILEFRGTCKICTN